MTMKDMGGQEVTNWRFPLLMRVRIPEIRKYFPCVLNSRHIINEASVSDKKKRIAVRQLSLQSTGQVLSSRRQAVTN